MSNLRVRKALWAVSFAVFVVLSWISFRPETVVAAHPRETSGSLQIIGKDGTAKGLCPLKHTDVRGAISGFLARVTVTQTFENNSPQKIEAVYAFPLPENAAVDDMTIQIGDRTVRGVIKKREEARAIYENAKNTGHVAALLDQERPNIFTQSVANIMPGEQVVVTISYAQTLAYEEGAYEFIFPMVVGPRYIPGNVTGKQAGGWAPDTDQVPDASRITPQVTPKGTRAGHDISLQLAIDAGVPLQALRSSSHEIDVQRNGTSAALVKLRNEAEIPNKDFVLKYNVAGEQIADAILTQAAPAGSKLPAGGYFSLILQPPARVLDSDITPKELVFVVDTSGSMYGFPIEKAKELITHALDGLNPGDTFNLITFSGDTHILFTEPVFPTAENIRLAKQFLQSRSGGGGTEMMKAIRAALDPSDSQDHLRVVCFATDGYVGNDLEIIGEVQKHTNARVFAFGIGTSVNRFLIEGMARAGRGESEVVTLNDKADIAAKRLYERLRAPLLTDIAIDWGGLPVTDVYPQAFPDLFSGKPLIISGRYTSAGSGTIRLLGKRASENFVREIPVRFTADAATHDVLPGFWARRKIDALMSQDWSGLQSGNMKPELQKQITQLGLDYRLMTQFTSFVAVEERVVTEDGKPRRVDVPVEMPEGVTYEGVFGEQDDKDVAQRAWPAALSKQARVAPGAAGGVMGGVAMSKSMAPPPPPPPPPPPSSVVANQTVQVSSQAFEVETVTTSVEKRPTGDRAILESKLHSTLLSAFDCAKKPEQTCKLVDAGNVEVEIWLKVSSPTILAQLKALGFDANQGGSRKDVLSGHLPVAKLLELAKLDAVRFVAPVRR